MPFISVSDGLIKKSTTSVENKFITKYLPELEPNAVKVYLYALYLFQSSSHYSVEDMAKSLNLSEDEIKNYFTYLEEMELVSVLSTSPYEIKILEADNLSGTPKKIKPEKYADFSKSVQSIISGRMISTNEFLEYFIFLEEYKFETNALLMIINYCVSWQDNKVGFRYIKTVIKDFAKEGVITAKEVEKKLADFTSSTPSLVKLFNAVGIKKKPGFDEDKLYKKWTERLGFDDSAIIYAAKQFKAKTCEKIDAALEELFKFKKFDVKEIEDFCKNKNSIYSLTLDIAKNLGVYMQNSAPYVENYVSNWCNYGFTFECLKQISVYCFKQSKNSFEDMNMLVQKLYDSGIVADKSVDEYIARTLADDKLLKELLSSCGLTRKILPWDRENLAKWRSWNFSDDMLFEAAKLSSGKSNPFAYMNGVLSAWKAEGIYTKDKLLPSTPSVKTENQSGGELRAQIERHYFDLRNLAEQRAESVLASATSDKIYGDINKRLKELSIKLAFAEISDKEQAANINKSILELEAMGDRRLSELCIDKAEFTPRYSCEICGDTGYDKTGKPCVCLKKFLSTL